MVSSTAQVGKPTKRCFAQAVGGTVRRQAGFVAAIPEPIAKPCGSEWGTRGRREVSQMIGRGSFDRLAKLTVDRDLQPLAGFLLDHAQQPIDQVLSSHLHDIRSPLCGIKKKIERQSGAATDRKVIFINRNFVFGPAMKTLTADTNFPNAD
jgi:hypothetical protein